MWSRALSASAVLLFGWVTTAASVELGRCDDERLGQRAECGIVTVAEDRSRPDGRTVGLRVVVLRAAQSSGKAPLFALAGGPGQGATDLAELALGPWQSVLEVRDVVLVDQRGTGGSNRLDCPNRAAEDPASAFGKLFDPANIRGCLERTTAHADPTLYGTPRVVDDLERVRRDLGYDRVVLWGGSGGTRTALVWARRHPETVEAMGVHLAVVCSEDVPFVDRERAADSAAGTFLGTYLVEQYTAACEAWRAEPVAESFLEPVRSNVPTLLVSGYYDPSTPAWMAEEVARHLSRSRHLVVRNEAHGAEFGCARQATVEFLRSGSLEGLGAVCEGVGPVEFVAD